VLAANPATLPLTARFKKFFAQRTLAESTRKNNLKFFYIGNMTESFSND